MSALSTPEQLLGPLEALRPRVGGGALALLQLGRAGLPVPPWVVVEAGAQPEDDTLPDGLEAELAAGLADLGAGPLVVRASAVNPDPPQSSETTTVGVEGGEDLAEALVRAWTAGEGSRARAYRRERGLRPPPAAVVVHRLVLAEASGVVSTAETRGGGVHVAAAWGFEADAADAPVDTWRLGTDGEIVEQQVAHKPVAVVWSEHGALAVVEVPAPDQDRPCLPREVLRELARHARRLRAVVAAPVRLGFVATSTGEVWFTGMETVVTADGEPRRWDAEGMLEATTGLVTPLSFSLLQRMRSVFVTLGLRSLGVDPVRVQERRSDLDALLGLVRGRVYDTVDGWEAVRNLLPGLPEHQQLWAWGLGAPAEVGGAPKGGSPVAASLSGLAWLRLARQARGLGRRLAALERGLEAQRAALTAEVLRGLSAQALVERIETVERELLWSFTPAVVNTLVAQVTWQWLAQAAGESGLDPVHGANTLLLGDGDDATVAPVVDGLRLLDQVRRTPAIAELFLADLPEGEVVEWARRNAGFETSLQHWVSKHGWLGPGALAVESRPVAAAPSILAAALRSWLVNGAVGPEEAGAVGRRDRDELERRLLGSRRGWRRQWARLVLREARAAARRRAQAWVLEVRVVDLTRQLVQELGVRLAGRGLVELPEDVYWLSLGELTGFVRGTSPTVRLSSLVADRKAEWAGYLLGAPPPLRVVTRGPVGAARPEPAERAPAWGPLPASGVPASPGSGRGRAFVADDPSEVLGAGRCVLVVDRFDPGWALALPLAAGVVSEHGNPASHGAVVLRELGIPAVFGVAGARARLAGLDLVVDGTAGTVAVDPGAEPSGTTPVATAPEPTAGVATGADGEGVGPR